MSEAGGDGWGRVPHDDLFLSENTFLLVQFYYFMKLKEGSPS